MPSYPSIARTLRRTFVTRLIISNSCPLIIVDCLYNLQAPCLVDVYISVTICLCAETMARFSGLGIASYSTLQNCIDVFKESYGHITFSIGSLGIFTLSTTTHTHTKLSFIKDSTFMEASCQQGRRTYNERPCSPFFSWLCAT